MPTLIRRLQQSAFACTLLLILLLKCALPAALAQAVHTVDAVGLTVADMERSLAFYTRVLQFEMVSDVEVAGEAYERLQGIFGLRMRVVRLKLGDETIALTEYLTPKGRPAPVDARSHDRWFQHIAIIVSDMDRAYQRLRQHRVEHVSPSPQRLPDWNPKAGGIRAFYFKDPDGHPLEILQFPPDKGDPKWHQAGERLFVGIDHTAIVVANTEASLRFYRDVLGLRIAGESENYGSEQERLNNVFGARLHITTLRAEAGPGIELLEYLSPQDGRPAPLDARSNDLSYWQTTLVVPDVARLARTLRTQAFSWLSSSVVALPDNQLGYAHAMVVRDPDGHAMQLVGP